VGQFPGRKLFAEISRCISRLSIQIKSEAGAERLLYPFYRLIYRLFCQFSLYRLYQAIPIRAFAMDLKIALELRSRGATWRYRIRG